jgi:hypothetical protein
LFSRPQKPAIIWRVENLLESTGELRVSSDGIFSSSDGLLNSSIKISVGAVLSAGEKGSSLDQRSALDQTTIGRALNDGSTNETTSVGVAKERTTLEELLTMNNSLDGRLNNSWSLDYLGRELDRLLDQRLLNNRD